MRYGLFFTKGRYFLGAILLIVLQGCIPGGGSGVFSESSSKTNNSVSKPTLSVTTATLLQKNKCSPIIFSLKSDTDALVDAPQDLMLQVSGLAEGEFYSDSDCLVSQANQFNIGQGTSSKILYLKPSASKEYILQIVDTSKVSSDLVQIISVAEVPSTQVGVSKLVWSGPSFAPAGTCNAFNIAIQDSTGQAVDQLSAVLLNLYGNGNGTFFSDSACSAAVSNVSVGTGTSSKNIYFKSNVPESLSFTAQALGFVEVAKMFQVQAQPASKIVLMGSGSIQSGVCVPYTVTILDTLNNLSPAGTGKTLNYSGAGTGAFYSDSGCSVSISNNILASSQTTATVYFKASSAQSLSLVVDDSGLPDLASSTLPVVVNASATGPNMALQMSGASSVNTNICTPYAVLVTDLSGHSVNVASNVSVSVGGAGSGTFYSDSTCTTSATTVTLQVGTSLSYIYFKAAAAQNLVFSLTAANSSTGTYAVSVVVATSGAVPTKLVLNGTNSITPGSCVPYIASISDGNGNSIAATAITSITLSGAGSGAFYSDSACNTTATTLSVASGSSYQNFYYKNANAQNLIFVAQSTGLSNASLPVTIASSSSGTAGPPVKLAFVAQPSSIATVNVSLATQPIVIIQDSNNNVVNTSSATITLAAFTDSACTIGAGGTLSATTNPLPASSGIANFAGINESNAQTLYLGASSPGLASACSTAIQVYPSVPAKLSFSVQPSSTGTAGAVLAVQPKVSVLNYTGQVMTNSTNSVSISAYSDSLCTTPAVGTFNVTTNNLLPSSGVVSFAGVSYSVATTIYLKASSSGLSSTCSTGIVISPSAANVLSFYLAPPTTATAGQGFPVQVTVRDAFGNIAPVSDNITLTGYASSNCTGAPISGFTGGSSTAASLGTASFSTVTETVAGTLSIKAVDATDNAVTSVCSNQINVQGGAATTLSFVVQPAATGFAYSNLLTSPVVRITDTYGNIVATANNAVAISAFTDAACSTAASGNLVAANNPVSPNSGQASFAGVSYSAAGTIYLKASSTGLTAACSNAIVIGGAVSAIATGADHTCAISNSNVYCWGNNTYGQLGNNSYNVTSVNIPTQVFGVGGTGYLTGIIAIAAGYRYTCAVSGAGAVYCWGYNPYGNLGDNTTTGRYVPVQVVSSSGGGVLSNISRIAIGSGASGAGHTCALDTAGSVFCWGYNGYGQLGNGSSANRNYPTQVLNVGGVGNLSGIVAISAGGYYGSTCAVSNAGSVYCWGDNSWGQLGNSSTNSSTSPAQVVGTSGTGTLASIAGVSVGNIHTCAVSTAGDVYCWGANGYGQLGVNNTSQYNYPKQVLGTSGSGTLSSISMVAAGGYSSNRGSTCAVASSGAVYCWGDNSLGQLGTNNTTQSNIPKQVVGVGATGTLSNIYNIAMASGDSYTQSCALSTTGEVMCFGSNYFGQLGNGQSNNTSTSPLRVWQPGSVAFTHIAAGATHACGVSGGAVYCWGDNTYGKLGDGTTNTRLNPVQVLGVGGTGFLSGIVSVYVSSRGESAIGHTCAVSGAGTVYCWGNNSNSQLGDGTGTDRSTPVLVNGLTGVVSLGLSWTSSCAVTAAGSAYCWGYNATGQLGDNTTTTRSTPVQVVGAGASGTLSGVTAISTSFSNSYGHTCAVVGGAAYCWGSNNNNQLGDGTSVGKNYPVLVGGMGSGVTAIMTAPSYNSSIGDYGGYSCGIKSGSVACWGYKHNGGAIGSTATSGYGTNAVAITGGREGPCYVSTSGKVYCSSFRNGAINVTDLSNVQQFSNTSYSYSDGNYEIGCAIVTGGSVLCVNGSSGLNNGRMGNSSASSSTNFWMITSPIPTALSIASIATGGASSCAVGNGSVNCWGGGTNGALGNGGTAQVNTTSNVLFGNINLSSMATVTSGGTHACGISSNGSVYCWGDNLYGDLGNNSTTQSTTAVQVTGQGGIGYLSSVTSLASGYHHNCAVTGGSVYCWGWDGFGQLGNNSTISAAVPTQVVGVGGTGYLSGFTKVTAGYAHSCGLKSDGTVFCWGNNTYGQLGNSSFNQSNTPVQVVSVSGTGTLTNVSAIAAGTYHTCAIAGGQVFCWGANDNNQLGNALTTPSSYPQGTLNSGYVGLTGATGITAGANFSCITTSSGGVKCWGAGSNGQMGSGGTSAQNVAMDVIGTNGTGTLTGISTVAAGSTGYHACALNTAGTAVFCWGAGGSGQMGTGATPSIQSTPTQATVAIVGISYFVAR